MELGPLIEEEEEEEDTVELKSAALPVQPTAPALAPTPPASVPVTTPAPATVLPATTTAAAVVTPPPAFKSRPHNLDLRALTVSTAPSVVSTAATSIPTPAQTPSPRVAGLKSLTLSSSSLIHSSSPLSGGVRLSSVASPVKGIVRKSSISYRRSDDADGSRSPTIHQVVYSRPQLLPSLMTPEPTPTSASPPGTPAEMSPSRRTFIYQSHSALVSRVSELERLLASQSPTVMSPVSSTSDEFLALIADLKSERDELKRDVQGWRIRVSNLEQQNTNLSDRVENERREAWTVREQLGALQIEKTSLDNDYKQLQSTSGALQTQVTSLQAQLDEMRRERDAALHGLELATRPRSTLRPSARPNANGQSIDSLSSTTDVDSVPSQRSSLVAGLVSKLKVVQEEDSEFYRAVEQRPLSVPQYEDDSDDSFYSRSRTNSACSVNLSVEPASPVSDDEHMHHKRRDTLSRWNFAKASSAPRNERASSEVDRFFVCLDDQDTSPDEDVTIVRPSAGFGGFGAPLDEDDDMPPFVLPTQRDGQAKFPVVHDTYDDEDDGMNFVIPVSVPELKSSLKPASMTFSVREFSFDAASARASCRKQISSHASTVPSSRRQQADDAECPSPSTSVEGANRAYSTLVNSEAGSSRRSASRFSFPNRRLLPTPTYASETIPASPASVSNFTTDATNATTLSSTSSIAFGAPSTPRRRPRLNLSSAIPPSLDPVQPISPFSARLPSLSSLWDGLMSPIAASVPRGAPKMVSREAQLDRLRARLQHGSKDHSTWDVPCAHCGTSSRVVQL